MQNKKQKSVLSNLSFLIFFILTVALNVAMFFYIKRLLPSITAELHFSLISTTLIVSVVFLMFIYLNNRIACLVESHISDNNGMLLDIDRSFESSEKDQNQKYQSSNQQSEIVSQTSSLDDNISDVFKKGISPTPDDEVTSQMQKFQATLRPIHKLPKNLQHYYWLDIVDINHNLINGISEITNNNFFEQKTLLINFNKLVISDQILINRVIDQLEKNQSLLQKIIIVVPSYSLDTIANLRNVDKISKLSIEKVLSLSRLGFRFAIHYQKGIELDTSTLLTHSIGLVVINHQSHPIDLSAPFSFDVLAAVIDNLSNYGIDILADELNDQKTFLTYNDLKLRFVSGLNFSQPIKFKS